MTAKTVPLNSKVCAQAVGQWHRDDGNLVNKCSEVEKSQHKEDSEIKH